MCQKWGQVYAHKLYCYGVAGVEGSKRIIQNVPNLSLGMPNRTPVLMDIKFSLSSERRVSAAVRGTATHYLRLETRSLRQEPPFSTGRSCVSYTRLRTIEHALSAVAIDGVPPVESSRPAKA